MNIQDELVKDPYCMTYIPKKNALRMHIKDEEHYFCSKECLSKYSEKVRKAS